MESTPLLEVQQLYKCFPVAWPGWKQPDRFVHAVNGVSFHLQRAEILALVGESGCGKTTLMLALMGLEEPQSGKIIFQGRDVTHLPGHARKELRRQVQMIFQDPYESLNPLMTVGEIVGEPLQVHRLVKTAAQREQRVCQALEDAGLKPAAHFLHRRPHELSGGQRQRVVIAGALVLEPVLLLADEPVSMLDVSIRAEIVNLLSTLRETRGISVIFITHDLSTVAHIADRVAVMYLGRIVELGRTADVLTKPQHPYTRALLSVIPRPDPRLRRERMILQGDPPDPIDLPSGCSFHPRCPLALDQCAQVDPPLRHVAKEHMAACLLLTEEHRENRE